MTTRLWSRRRALRTLAGTAGAAGGAGLVLTASGCAIGDRAPQPARITQWNGWTGTQGILAQRKLARSFNRSSDLRVTQTGYPWDTLFSKLPAAAAAGNPPKVVVLHITEIPQFADLGVLRPLDDLVPDAGIDLSGISHKQVEACSYGGHLYAVPGDQHPFALWYNTDLATEAGLDPDNPPATGHEFQAWVRALTVRGNSGVRQYGFQLPYRGSTTARWFFQTLLAQFGGTFLTEDKDRCVVDSEAGREALQIVVDLIASGRAATGGSQQDPVAAGTVGMWVSGSWELRLRIDAGLPFATATVPVFGDHPAAWANSHCLALTNVQTDAEAEASMAYVRHFYDHYAVPASTVGFIPMNPEARDDPTLTESAGFRHYRPFIEALEHEHTVLEPALVAYRKLFSFGRPTPVNENIAAAIDRKKTVPEALADLQAGVNEILTT